LPLTPERRVADRFGRSAEEREAARLERERRRTARDGRGAPAPAPPPAPEPAFDGFDDAFDDGFDDGHDGGYEGQPVGAPSDHEAPSGTRRVRGVRSRPAREPGSAARGPRFTRRRALALIPLLLGIALVWFLIELFQPFSGSGHGHITVRIPPHATSGQIGDLLAKDGVISSSFFFELRATLDGERGSMRSGTYHLQFGMSYGDVLKILTTPPPAVPTTQVTLIPGKSRQQIDALLRSQHVKGSYKAATRRSPLLNPARYGAPRNVGSLEGFLWPSTYFVTEPIKLGQLVAKQLTAFKQAFATVNMSWAKRHGFTPYDVLIVASIVEDETPSAHDRPLIASVIYNRLRQGTPLQMDSTVRFAVDNYTTPITQSQLASSSPWNTYIHRGLPPTPIDNPGIGSLRAAAHPANTNYLFFVAKPCGNGTSLFASTYQQFQSEEAQYNNARKARGGRSPVNCK
jgi:UPF0755 protein